MTNIADKLRPENGPRWRWRYLLLIPALLVTLVVIIVLTGLFERHDVRAVAPMPVRSEVFHKLMTAHPLKSLDPPPPPVVEEPSTGGGGGGGGIDPNSCEAQGLYTVNGSCVADLCSMYGDLDGDGNATDCLAYYQRVTARLFVLSP